MKLLLDTCTFLWWSQGSARIPKEVHGLVADPGNDVYVSAATAWELAVKHGLGKLDLPAPPDVFVPTRREWYDFKSYRSTRPAHCSFGGSQPCTAIPLTAS